MDNPSTQIWKPEESFSGLLMVVANKFSEGGREALDKAKLNHLSYTRMSVLAYLAEEPQTQADLCEKLGHKAPSVMEFLQRLHKQGLVKSKSDAHDKRKKIWSLTPKGKSQLTKAKGVLRRRGQKLDKYFQKMKVTKKENARLRVLFEGLLEYDL